MIVVHNMMAANTERQLGINNKAKNKAMEKLSTGYRVNRAADDASGLAVSEEMRAQIRGLMRGSHNISDGQNMINTAEGAITEQINILQRMRELTIEAYNDTLTQDDRLNIQFEIDELSKEIDHIARDTEFNTIKVLQGDHAIIRTKVITQTTPARDCMLTINSVKNFPAWIGCDDQLQLTGNINTIDRSSLQDTSTYVRLDTYEVTETDGTLSSHATAAYGPAGGGSDSTSQAYYAQDSKELGSDGTIVYKGEWSKDITDNYATAMNFSAIANCTSRTELLEKITEMVGTGVSFHCGTCSTISLSKRYTETIAFESDDTIVDKRDINDKNDKRVISLQSCLDEACQLLDETEFNALNASSGGTDPLLQGYTNWNGYKNYIASVSQGIASKIVNNILTQCNFDNHFMRIVQDNSNPYQVDIYDFRDGDKIADAANGKVVTNGPMKIKTLITLPENVQEMKFTETTVQGYWIQMRANNHQGEFIHFPNTSLDALGLTDYTIFQQGYCSVTADKTWDGGLMKNAEYLGNHKYKITTGGTPGTPATKITETHTGTKTEKYREVISTKIIQHPPGYDKNGEYIPGWVEKEEIYGPEQTRTTTYTYTTTRYEGGTPGTPGKAVTLYAYPPDSLVRLDNALGKLIKSRSELGAMYNRMEHAYLDDTNDAENLQAAESRIRDTDYAEEMVKYSVASILEQAGFSMLTQANQQTQGVLQLLK